MSEIKLGIVKYENLVSHRRKWGAKVNRFQQQGIFRFATDPIFLLSSGHMFRYRFWCMHHERSVVFNVGAIGSESFGFYGDGFKDKVCIGYVDALSFLMDRVEDSVRAVARFDKFHGNPLSRWEAEMMQPDKRFAPSVW